MSVLLGFAPAPRRRFLIAAAAVAASAAAGGGGLLALRGRAPHVEGLRCLGDHEHRTLAALAAALFPASGPLGPAAHGADLARAFDGFLADEPAHNRDDLKRALLWLELGPVIHERRAVTFSNLDEAGRLAHFERWMSSGDLLRRQVATAFRRFLSLVFYDRPEAWPAIGYPGPLFGLREAR